MLRNWRVVKVATTKGQRKLFFNLRNRKKSLGWLTAEETQAIAEDLGVAAKVVTLMEGRLASRDVGFDGDDADDGDRSNNLGAPAQFLHGILLNLTYPLGRNTVVLCQFL